MRRRGAKDTFWGPNLPAGQRACRRYEKEPHGGFGEFKYSLPWDETGASNMVSFADRYPKQGGTFLKAADLRGKPDLVVEIASVDLDKQVSNKSLDVVRFKNCEYSLVLNQTTGKVIVSLYGDDTDDWLGGAIALFCDDTVSFTDQEGVDHQGGVRVRPYKPDGEAVEANKPAPTKPDFDDAIPF
jgi:hypothetical protein